MICVTVVRMPLNVIDNQPTQKCDGCNFATKCYSMSTSTNNVILNILACRIIKGIDMNKSSKLLLQMIKPILIKLVHNARTIGGKSYVDFDTLICDLESRVIECLLDKENGYQIGGSAYLTEYLFGTNPRTGWVRKWILWQFSKQQRFRKRHVLLGTSPQSDSDRDDDDLALSSNDRSTIRIREAEIAQQVDNSQEETVKAIMDIIDDGVTLNSNEYRVMSFCLTHANELNKSRLIDGTHTYLSSIMKVSRPRITRLYAVSKRKIIETANKRGLEILT